MVGLFDEPDVPDGDAAGATAVGGPMILPSGSEIDVLMSPDMAGDFLSMPENIDMNPAVQQQQGAEAEGNQEAVQ